MKKVSIGIRRKGGENDPKADVVVLLNIDGCKSIVLGSERCNSNFSANWDITKHLDLVLDDLEIEMISVESSNIESIGYDLVESDLYVKFKNGSEYKYKSVPIKIYDKLIAADSVGSFFNRQVKDMFEFEKLKEKKT